MTLNQRLDLIKPKILQDNFKLGRGIANEINFWIFEYDPEDEMTVRAYINNLSQNINSERDDVKIINFDLYKIMLEHLEQRNYLDKVLDMEQKKNSLEIINPIKRTLRLTTDENLVAKKISESIQTDNDIIFISGVGKAWPIVRSHTILNNLHSKINNTPVIMFFPGAYDNELKLFKEISDDNYYRAFKLIER